MGKRPVIIVLVVFLSVFSMDNAYAQFWKRWFNKDKESRESAPAGEAKAQKDKAKNSETLENRAEEKKTAGEMYSQAEDIMKKQLAEDAKEAQPDKTPTITAEDIQSTSQKANSRTGYAPESRGRTGEGVQDDIDNSRKEEQLRRTQEQVEQIRRTEQLNNSQSSLERINKINEFNRQQKRIDDINKLNKRQKNLDDLRQLNSTKK